MTQKILITGCSTGFGFSAAKRLADRGHEVYATMRSVTTRNHEAAQALKDYASQNGVSLRVLELDVTSDASVAAAFAHVPPLDVVINNAGVGFGGPVESFSSKQILNQLDINIVGTLRVIRAALPEMRKQGSGLIIQVSSTAGRAAFPGFGVYHASKWGLEGISEALRYELAPLGIDVAIVEPGPFSTHFFPNLVGGVDENMARAYGHVAEFGERFQGMVQEVFEDPDAPTDPAVVVDLFEKLIDMPAGERPLRTIAGLDFGFQALNDAVEPIRKGALEMMGIAEWDGVRAKTGA